MAEPSFLAKLQASLNGLKVDAFWLPRADKFQGEEVRAHQERLAKVTGFTGSAGLAIILKKQAALFVDGRYTEQAASQTDGTPIKALSSAGNGPADWLKKQKKVETLGIDPWTVTAAQARKLKRELQAAQIDMIPLDENPVDTLWQNAPQPDNARVREHAIEWAGQNSFDKRKAILKEIPDNHALFIGSPQSCSWLLNVRANFLANTPSVLSFAILRSDGSVDWIVEPEGQNSARALKLDNVRIAKDFEKTLKDLDEPLIYDPTETPWAVELMMAKRLTRAMASPVALLQACQNKAELEGMRKAHVTDGAVMVKFLASLSGQLPGFVDEIQAQEQLDAMRLEAGAYALAFATISAAGPNAALPHYRATPDSMRPSADGELYLVDSGGQYPSGTTDITRVVAVSEPSAEQRRLYTLVLQGHLAVMRARFPAGTSGAALDPLARMPLWQAGLDFDHGTGHGVGACLGVHDGPQRISKAASGVALKPGMVLSVEPGYYRPGDLGIRIENLVIVKKAKKKSDERDMLAFENLTWCPYARELIDPALLSPDEISQVNAYHKATFEKLKGLVKGGDLAWLTEACKPL